ncbi:MAG: DUF2905 domain-containing protein [Candidatus Omnitrophota bacterium]
MLTMFAKVLIISGMLLVLLGIVLSFAGKIPWLGRLPGDILVKRDNFTFYFPLATSLLLSAMITLLFWFFKR